MTFSFRRVERLLPASIAKWQSRLLAVAHGRRLASELRIVGAILEQPVIEKILPLMAVYLYAEPVTTPGFVFMDSPGFDLVSTTGQIAGGAAPLKSRSSRHCGSRAPRRR